MMNMPTDIGALVANLLVKAGIDATVESIALSNAGGNNRLYRVGTSAGTFAVKQYFRHEGDTRDRLAAEYGFLVYAHEIVPGMVPRPLAHDPESGIALYEFVAGEPLSHGSIGQTEIDAAIAFFLALNSSQARQSASMLPRASESSFSIAGHLDLVGSRVAQLLTARQTAEVDEAGNAFIGALAAKWERIANSVNAATRSLGWDSEQTLPQSQRCISPSDFGFHNVLRSSERAIRFVDFEYAGWDDPAKTTGDFFAQLAVPVPSEYFEYFIAGIMQPFPDSSELADRARLLRPVYQVKWCCIALNIFLPVHLARRKFANPALDETALKTAQLTKAVNLFQNIQELNHGIH